jgi:hypothetical protein
MTAADLVLYLFDDTRGNGIFDGDATLLDSSGVST